MSEVDPSVELLAPVPLEHLQSGLDVLAREPFVALGSRAWQVFRRLDELRAYHPVRVWIYASDNDGQPQPPSATWSGLYVGQVEGRDGAHPAGMRYRPATTALYPGDNQGWWAIFWHVAELRELPPNERVAVARMTGFGKKRPYGHPFQPEGPMLIEPVG
jgi:hypothetical protein